MPEVWQGEGRDTYPVFALLRRRHPGDKGDTMNYEEMVEERSRRAAERMKVYVAAGRVTQELLDALDLRGSPGFMGQGTYSNANVRRAGYRRR